MGLKVLFLTLRVNKQLLSSLLRKVILITVLILKLQLKTLKKQLYIATNRLFFFFIF